MRKTFLFLSLIFILTFITMSGFAVDNFTLSVEPGIAVPLGPKSSLFSEGAIYKIGATTTVRGQYIFPSLPVLYVNGLFNYGIQPTQADILSLLSLGAGAGVNFRFGDRMSVQAGAEAGWYLGIFPGLPVGSNPYFGGTAAVSWDLTPGFTLAAGAGYRYFLGYDSSAGTFTDQYQGVHASVGAVFHLDAAGETRSNLNIEGIEFEPVFPVFYSYYDDHKVGSVQIRNGENSSIKDLEISFFVNQYMEQPKMSAVVPELGRGESVAVDLNALFTNNVIYLTESTKVSSEIVAEYTYLGKRFTQRIPHTLKIFDRNSMTWDDDRKAACFITAKDPTVLLFSKNTAGLIREQGNTPVNLNLRIAMGLFETLKLFGVNYVIDPKSSYVEASENSQFIDYLQFPSQTLTYRAGDCDDLSILYNSLLESVGIETAFITIPGHIFMAFSLDMSEGEARKEFNNHGDFIFHEDNTWVPVEITMISDGFMKAWKMGAREWREATTKNSAVFYPIHDAWQVYEPIGLPGNALSLVYPSTDSIIEKYTESLDQFIDREISTEIASFQEKINSGGDSARLRNKFGVLYARYGRFEEAQQQFQRAIDYDRNYSPAVFNLGNLHYLNGDMEKSLDWYRRADELKPNSKKVVLALARVNYALEEYEKVEEDYNQLKSLDPELAVEYAYLVDVSAAVGRASAQTDKGKTLWEEEE